LVGGVVVYGGNANGRGRATVVRPEIRRDDQNRPRDAIYKRIIKHGALGLIRAHADVPAGRRVDFVDKDWSVGANTGP
jgi:hypothetical protein